MRKWMISLFSVLALAFAFAGCGGVQGNSSSATSSAGNGGGNGQIVTPPAGSENASDTNEYGISSELGTPPELPSS